MGVPRAVVTRMADRDEPPIEEVMVLVGHGARDPAWAGPLERIAARLRDNGTRVELAFLEFLQPELSSALEALCREGVRDIRVVPVMIGAGAHAMRDIGQRVDAARRAHGMVRISLALPVGEVPQVATAIADAIALRVGPAAKPEGK